MTRLLVAGESLTKTDQDRRRLPGWRDALVGLRVTSPDEEVEPVDTATAAPGRIIVVVREQLDHLNALYCRAVLELETFDDFESFVVRAVGSGRHDLGVQLVPLLESADTDLVAVPYSHLRLDSTLPGPLLVTAVRVLHKRLTRVRALRPIEWNLVVAAAAQVREQAETRAWDGTTYWGWSAERAAEAEERFRPGNEELARRAWGTAWPDPPAPRDQTRVDLAGCRPEIVSDVLTTIQQAVDSVRV